MAICKKQNGFTLVELAIALMVIGLLIGGVLKGQELINNARITRLVKDVNDYDTAVMIFRNTYGGLPGDLRKPSRVPNCDTAPCNSMANVGNGIYNHTTKWITFWLHLQNAGLISNIDYTDSHFEASPRNVLNGHYSMNYTVSGNPYPAGADSAKNRLYIRHPQTLPSNASGYYMLPNIARQIDEKMDDGKPMTGSVLYQHRSLHGFQLNDGPCVDGTDESGGYPTTYSQCSTTYILPGVQ